MKKIIIFIFVILCCICLSCDDGFEDIENIINFNQKWLQQAYAKAANTDADDYFGFAIAVSGDTMVVGANSEDSNAIGVTNSTGASSDDTVLQSGAAYVFVRNGDSWIQQAYLKASNTDASDLFGYSVAISGDTIVVGARNEQSNATGVTNGTSASADNSANESGAAYVYVRNGSSWVQQAYLKAANTGAIDRFGYSISISGDTIVVGARYEDSSATGVTNGTGSSEPGTSADSGAAYVFVRSGSTWSQQAYLKASDTEDDCGFGFSVAIDGDTIAVGTRHDPGNIDWVYVFIRNGSTWNQQQKLTAVNAEATDLFGSAVAISNDTLVVGARGEGSNTMGVINGAGAPTDNNASDIGAAYVYVRSGSTWTQQAYLKASNTGAGDGFGFSASISGDTIVVGAWKEDSNATGVTNGPGFSGTDDGANNDSGSAYVFVRYGDNWYQQTYLKAANTGAVDWFGYSASISGDTIVIGAVYESSESIGVTNGSGYSGVDGALYSGAAYVFYRDH